MKVLEELVKVAQANPLACFLLSSMGLLFLFLRHLKKRNEGGS